MRAVVLKRPGGVEELHCEEIPTPEVGPGRVLVAVRACGVAHRDVIERRGGHPALATPIVQGHEFAGEVVAVGEGVARWRAGDRVVSLYTDSCGVCEHCIGGEERLCRGVREAYGLTANGGYAEYVLVRERGLERLRDGIAWEVGAVLMGTLGVAWENLVGNARVRPGEHVLVTGASGGVGAAALQVAKRVGATLWAVTSSEQKKSALEALGAHRVLVDREGRFHELVRAIRPEGVDAVIDCVGAPTLGASMRSLRRFGRVVAIGTIGSPRFDLALGYLVVNSIKLLGSDNVSRGALRTVMELVAAGRLDVPVDRRLPLAAAAEAQALVEQRQPVGRVVLVPDRG